MNKTLIVLAVTALSAGVSGCNRTSAVDVCVRDSITHERVPDVDVSLVDGGLIHDSGRTGPDGIVALDMPELHEWPRLALRRPGYSESTLRFSGRLEGWTIVPPPMNGQNPKLEVSTLASAQETSSSNP